MNAQVMFGVGALYLKAADGTSHKVAVLQDVSIEGSASTKELIGAYRYAVDVANGNQKMSVKAKFATVDPDLYATILGGTVAAGSVIHHEYVQVIPGTPFQITIPNPSGFVNLGVKIAGVDAVKDATASAAGKYAVTAGGQYTFNTLDAGKVAEISYTYTSATGKTVTLDNTKMGAAVKFELLAFNEYDGKKFGIQLYSVVAPKLSVALKNEDHTASDVDFTAFANASNQIGKLYFA